MNSNSSFCTSSFFPLGLGFEVCFHLGNRLRLVSPGGSALFYTPFLPLLSFSCQTQKNALFQKMPVLKSWFVKRSITSGGSCFRTLDLIHDIRRQVSDALDRSTTVVRPLHYVCTSCLVCGLNLMQSHLVSDTFLSVGSHRL